MFCYSHKLPNATCDLQGAILKGSFLPQSLISTTQAVTSRSTLSFDFAVFQPESSNEPRETTFNVTNWNPVLQSSVLRLRDSGCQARNKMKFQSCVITVPKGTRMNETRLLRIGDWEEGPLRLIFLLLFLSPFLSQLSAKRRKSA